MKEIKVEEVRMMPRDSYELIDIRDDGLVAYGMIPEAIHISCDELEKDTNSKLDAISKDKKLILYCEIGRKSRELDDLPSLSGRECLSLEGGYIGYIRDSLLHDSNTGEKQRFILGYLWRSGAYRAYSFGHHKNVKNRNECSKTTSYCM